MKESFSDYYYFIGAAFEKMARYVIYACLLRVLQPDITIFIDFSPGKLRREYCSFANGIQGRRYGRRVERVRLSRLTKLGKYMYQ